VSTATRRSNDWLLDQLPVAMAQERFFRGFVSIFQDVATSYLEHADGIPHLTEVDVTPAPMLPWLGSWVGVDVVDPELDEIRQRQLVATAARALAWRGTRIGLESWLEVITGGDVVVEDPGGVYGEGEAPMRAPIVRVRTDGTGWLSTADFVKVVLAELPVHISLELYVDHQLVHPPLEPALDVHEVAEALDLTAPIETTDDTDDTGDAGDTPEDDDPEETRG
jgi:phage tail-like protein